MIIYQLQMRMEIRVICIQALGVDIMTMMIFLQILLAVFVEVAYIMELLLLRKHPLVDLYSVKRK